MTLEEDVTDFANAIEAAAVNLKHRIAQRHGVTKEEMKPEAKDFDSLKWNIKTGGKGNYEQTTNESNQNNEVFQTLQKILKEHKGFVQLGGFKIWNHQNDPDTIDRRKC